MGLPGLEKSMVTPLSTDYELLTPVLGWEYHKFLREESIPSLKRDSPARGGKGMDHEL